MSYARTPDLPREHPQMKALARSMKAHKPMTCEECRFSTAWNLEGWLECQLQCETDAPISAETSGGAPIIVKLKHGCLAWEPRT